MRLDQLRLIPNIFMSEKILKNGLPVLIWIIIWGFPICLGTLKPMAFSTKMVCHGFQMISSLPAVCQVAFLSGFSLNVILVEGRITCASVSNDWRTCWETPTAGPAHDTTLWGTSVWDVWSDCLFAVELVGRSSIKGLLPDALLVQLPKKLLFWNAPCVQLCAWGIQSWLEKPWENHCSTLVTVGGFKLLFLHLTWHHDRKL